MRWETCFSGLARVLAASTLALLLVSACGNGSSLSDAEKEFCRSRSGGFSQETFEEAAISLGIADPQQELERIEGLFEGAFNEALESPEDPAAAGEEFWETIESDGVWVEICKAAFAARS